MPRLELTRSPDDRRLYILPGVGELRTGGLLSGGKVEAVAAGRTYTFARRGRVERVATATDAFGETAGHQDGKESLVWGSARWDLQPRSEGTAAFYALSRPGEEREVARFVLGPWGPRPLPVVVDGDARPDPGLLLFALFLMRLRTEAQNASAAGSTRTSGNG